MRKLKVLALSTLAIMAMVALSISVAGACDGAKKADATTASTTVKADAKVAGAGCASKAADAKTAEAKTAELKTASAGCASKAADAKVAGTKLAGAKCSSMTAKAAVASGHCTSAAAKGPADLVIETVRMPSGALAVFYSGETEATIAALQAKVAASPTEMGCDIAKCMSTNEYCSVEVAKTARGLMMLVTSDKAEVLDGYQERYTLAMATPETDESGE